MQWLYMFSIFAHTSEMSINSAAPDKRARKSNLTLSWFHDGHCVEVLMRDWEELYPSSKEQPTEALMWRQTLKQPLEGADVDSKGGVWVVEAAMRRRCDLGSSQCLLRV